MNKTELVRKNITVLIECFGITNCFVLPLMFSPKKFKLHYFLNNQYQNTRALYNADGLTLQIHNSTDSVNLAHAQKIPCHKSNEKHYFISLRNVNTLFN